MSAEENDDGHQCSPADVNSVEASVDRYFFL